MRGGAALWHCSRFPVSGGFTGVLRILGVWGGRGGLPAKTEGGSQGEMRKVNVIMLLK